MATGTKKLQIIITATATKAQKVFAKLKSGMRSIAGAGAKIGAGLAAGFAVAGVGWDHRREPFLHGCVGSRAPTVATDERHGCIFELA